MVRKKIEILVSKFIFLFWFDRMWREGSKEEVGSWEM